MKNFCKKYFLAILLVIIASCEKEAEKEFEDNPLSTQQVENKMLEINIPKADGQVELHSNVKVFNSDENALLRSISDASITFTDNSLLNDLKVGDILNSAPSALAPDGYNVKVLGIERKAGVVTLEVTNEVGFDQLFKEANFNYNLDDSGGVAKRPDLSVPLTFRLDKEVSGLVVRLDVKADLVFGFEYNTNAPGTADNYLKTKLGLNFRKDPSNPDLNVRFGGKASIQLPETKLPLDFTFWVGPVWVRFANYVRPELTVDSYVNAQLSAGVDLHGGFGFTYEQTGANPLNGRWSRYNNLRLDVLTPEYENAVAGRIKARMPRLKFSSKLWGSNVFTIFTSMANVYRYELDLTADYYIKAHNYTEFRAGVEGKVNLFVDQINYSAFSELTTGENLLGQWFKNPNHDAGGSTPGLGTGLRNRLFKGSYNKYISSENGATFATANRTQEGDWEKFNVVYNSSDDTYSILANNGKYLDVDQSSGGLIKANGSRYNGDCKFYIKSVGNGKYFLKSFSTGKYVSAEASGRLIANRTAVGAWERFEISSGSSTPPITETWKTILTPNQFLSPGQRRYSSNGRYNLVYQEDGNLVLYGQSGAVWSSKTWKPKPWNAGRAIMQGDGNFVVYTNAGQAVWHSHTYGKPGAYLQISDNGKIRVIRSGAVLWSS